MSFKKQNGPYLLEPRGAFMLVQSDAKPSGREGFTLLQQINTWRAGDGRVEYGSAEEHVIC